MTSDAQLPGDAIDAGQELALYEQRRNLQLCAALRDGAQSDRDDLCGTIAGTVPAERFFAPDNVARILVPLDAAA